MMTKQNKPRLYKSDRSEFLDTELRISVKSLFLLFFLVVGFFILAFLCKGPTMGYL